MQGPHVTQIHATIHRKLFIEKIVICNIPTASKSFGLKLSEAPQHIWWMLFNIVNHENKPGTLALKGYFIWNLILQLKRWKNFLATSAPEIQHSLGTFYLFSSLKRCSRIKLPAATIRLLILLRLKSRPAGLLELQHRDNDTSFTKNQSLAKKKKKQANKKTS